ncbi:MAG: hypothetical protein H8D43_03035 [Chloroflexi bacterium]|nr:hypothetical protein [Chloroflexota bacterium]
MAWPEVAGIKAEKDRMRRKRAEEKRLKMERVKQIREGKEAVERAKKQKIEAVAKNARDFLERVAEAEWGEDNYTVCDLSYMGTVIVNEKRERDTDAWGQFSIEVTESETIKVRSCVGEEEVPATDLQLKDALIRALEAGPCIRWIDYGPPQEAGT